MPIEKRLKGIAGFCPLVNKNASKKKQGQFHQGQYVPAAETGRPVCRIHKFPGSPKKYLPKKADCMVSYRYSSFRVDMVDCFLLIRFYHKPVRSCLIFMKKKSLFYAGFRVSQSPIFLYTMRGSDIF